MHASGVCYVLPWHCSLSPSPCWRQVSQAPLLQTIEATTAYSRLDGPRWAPKMFPNFSPSKGPSVPKGNESSAPVSPTNFQGTWNLVFSGVKIRKKSENGTKEKPGVCGFEDGVLSIFNFLGGLHTLKRKLKLNVQP